MRRTQVLCTSDCGDGSRKYKLLKIVSCDVT